MVKRLEEEKVDEKETGGGEGGWEKTVWMGEDSVDGEDLVEEKVEVEWKREPSGDRLTHLNIYHIKVFFTHEPFGD
jgi:hypothetical protein